MNTRLEANLQETYGDWVSGRVRPLSPICGRLWRNALGVWRRSASTVHLLGQGWAMKPRPAARVHACSLTLLTIPGCLGRMVYWKSAKRMRRIASPGRNSRMQFSLRMENRQVSTMGEYFFRGRLLWLEIEESGWHKASIPVIGKRVDIRTPGEGLWVALVEREKE